MARRLLNTDTAPGVLVAAFGAVVLVVGHRYPLGTVTSMGPGYVPAILGWLSVLLGLLLTGRGLLSQADEIDSHWPLRAFAFVIAGILAFAALIESAGLVITAIVVVLLVSLARPGFRLWPVAGLAAFLAALTVVIFIVGLGLPLTVGPD